MLLGLAFLAILFAPAWVAAPPLVINEVMPDPSVVTDANGEWFELHNTTGAAINVQNYTIGSANDAGFTIASSLSVPAGGYVVLARVASPGTNGGVTVDYAYGNAVNLVNTSDWLVLRDAGGTTVDSVSWSSTTAGRSWSLKNPWAAHASIVNGAVWGVATSTYGLGDFGTPRAQNDGFSGPPVAELTVRFLDVGQGDATYISNGTSKVMIDGGPSASRMGALLDSLGLNNSTFDVVVLSHQHLDHLAGLQELFRTSRNIRINQFFENQDVYSGVNLATLRDSINSRVAAGTLIYRDTDNPCADGSAICTVSLDGGAKLRIMKPKPSDANPNNRSAPVKLIGPDSASFTMWLAGDAEHDAIEWFMGAAGYAANPGMSVRVLKLDHHGSCNGITNAYVTTTNPEYVVAGVASSNGHKHMQTQAKTLLNAHWRPWYRTSGNGTVTFTTPGTPGGRYTVAAQKGLMNMSGVSDAPSVSSECNPIP